MSNYLQSRDVDSREYRCAVSRALAMPSCKLVPFFGTFLRDLRAILANVPAIIVFPTNAEQSLEVRTLRPMHYIFRQLLGTERLCTLSVQSHFRSPPSIDLAAVCASMYHTIHNLTITLTLNLTLT